MDTRIQNNRISELIQRTPIASPTAPPTPKKEVGGDDFRKLLEGQGVKVSGHAQTRLESRNIQLGEAEWERVKGGIDKAAAKGAKESLVMVDDVALVVSVKNRTVITAVDRNNLKDNVFTNIDSAVIV
ncbi:MAG: TIGR02530 family flagellar biosynthesis protein [Fimbriimonas sp.]